MRISDWSSDVCSSDLWCSSRSTCPTRTTRDLDPINIRALCLQADAELSGDPQLRAAAQRTVQRDEQIGRASCRERVCQYVWISVVAVSLKKKKKRKHSYAVTYTYILSSYHYSQ